MSRVRVDAFVADALFAVAAVIFLLWVLIGGAGCAGPLAHAKPLVAAPIERKPRPCLTTLPTRAKLDVLAEPEKVPYLGDGDEPRMAMRITVDAASLQAFFNYAETLESIARDALGCVIP